MLLSMCPEATQSMAHLGQPSGGSAEDSPECVSLSGLPVADSALPRESQVQLLEVLKEVRSIAERLVSANLQEQGRDNPTPSAGGDDMDACQCEYSMLMLLRSEALCPSAFSPGNSQQTTAGEGAGELARCGGGC